MEAINERARAVLDAAYTLGKEYDLKSADIAAFLDVALKPTAGIRKDLLSQDRQCDEYLWAGVGYDRAFEATDATGLEVVEKRGVVRKWCF